MALKSKYISLVNRRQLELKPRAVRTSLRSGVECYYTMLLPVPERFMLAELSDTRYRHMNRLETQLLTLIRHLAHC